MSLRDEILQSDDLEKEQVHVPEWGVDLWIRSLTAAERDAYENEIVKISDEGETEYDPSNMRAKLVARSVVDEDGQRVFRDADVDRLGGKSGKALDRLFSVAQRLTGITDEDMDELVGNSGSARPDGSPSD